MLKKCLFFIFIFLIIFSWSGLPVTAEENNNTVHIFSSPTCPHCATAKNFLDKLKTDKGLDFTVIDYDISKNIDQVKTFYQRYSVPPSQQGLVPAIFISDQYFIGFNSQTGRNIESLLLEEDIAESKLTKLPLLGEVDLLNFSLPALAITLGTVDGFNVCSLGALIIILGLVIILKSRRRIFLLGGTFILTTAIVYGLLIFLWHQFFSFIAPHIRSMEILIGLLAIAGGIYLLKEFYKAYKFGPVCSSNNVMSRLTPKIKRIFESKTNGLMVLGAVMLFATVATIVEFPCSAFLPVIFTSILVDAGISLSTSIFYIGLYMFFYLMDEIIIFIIAVLTLNIKIVSPKFIVFFNLLAAGIFILLGVYYLFGWLA